MKEFKELKAKCAENDRTGWRKRVKPHAIEGVEEKKISRLDKPSR